MKRDNIKAALLALCCVALWIGAWAAAELLAPSCGVLLR